MIVGSHSTNLPQLWDTGFDQSSVPAILTVVFTDFKFLVDGYRLSPEPARRFPNGFLTKFSIFYFQGRMSCIRTICFIVQGHRKISFA